MENDKCWKSSTALTKPLWAEKCVILFPCLAVRVICSGRRFLIPVAPYFPKVHFCVFNGFRGRPAPTKALVHDLMISVSSWTARISHLLFNRWKGRCRCKLSMFFPDRTKILHFFGSPIGTIASFFFHVVERLLCPMGRTKKIKMWASRGFEDWLTKIVKML